MRELIERLERDANGLMEATAQTLVRRTPKVVKRRAKTIRPKLVARLGPNKQTLWYETRAQTTQGKTWYQTVKVHPRPGSRRTLVAGLDVTMKCTCPHWVFSGAQWWALQEGYLYGLPRPKAIAPKLQRNLKPRTYMCKHLVAVVEDMKRRGTKFVPAG